MIGHPKPVSRLVERTEKRARVSRQRDETYRLVELRDGMRCRCCARRVVKTTALDRARLEHHHIRGRGRKDSETTANICVLCLECHEARHLTRTLTITGNADSTLTFSREERNPWYG